MYHKIAHKVSEGVTQLFFMPVIVLVSIILFFLCNLLGFTLAANGIILFAIGVGSIDLLKDTFSSLLHKKFALDYIALLAISVGVASGHFIVAAIIVLMLAGGQTLEKYAVARAKKSLTALIDRIPADVYLWKDGAIGKKKPIEDVTIGETIVVRKGEVIPLDGVLVSKSGLTDESSLTGEPYEIDKVAGDQIRSGTVNIGDILVVGVTKSDADSTYRKIVQMVAAAQEERSPLIRIADRYSTLFTFVTLLLSGFAFYISGGNWERVLAVLVIATPCPLILATPIALIGGMSAMAKHKIIVKKLAAIEVLSRVSDIMFDKTGTLTIGKPQVSDVHIIDKSFSRRDVCSIADAIERNSLHPLAKAIVAAAAQSGGKRLIAKDVQEKIGYGISGIVGRRRYILSKVHGAPGFAIELRSSSHRIATLHFEDTIKRDVVSLFAKLKHFGLRFSIFTGDKKAAADRLVSDFPFAVTVRAECTPEDKLNGIKQLRSLNHVSAMVGDGINDAPAVAAADVGMVFSSGEQTATSEAADIVFLAGDVSQVLVSYEIAKRTLAIALQSIWFGIGLSIIGMIFASLGVIPPIAGALLQEAIDIAVIFNALRASQ